MSKPVTAEQIRKVIVKRASEMLDNPDEHGIYPTTKFYNDLEADMKALVSQQEDYIIGEDDEPLVLGHGQNIDGTFQAIKHMKWQQRKRKINAEGEGKTNG